MLIVHVPVHVKPRKFVEAFRQATIENARESVKEPGVARFDVIQQTDGPRVSSWSRSTARRKPRRSTRRPRTTGDGGTRWPR